MINLHYLSFIFIYKTALASLKIKKQKLKQSLNILSFKKKKLSSSCF